jgi:hypothetical protein
VQSEEFKARFAPLLELAGKCRYLAEEMANTVLPFYPVPDTRDTLLRTQLIWMTPKACDTFDALVLLARNGWGVEAEVLLRVLMETAAAAALISQKPDPWLYLFLEDVVRQMRNQLLALDVARKQCGGVLPPDIEKEAQAAQRHVDEVTDWLNRVLGEPRDKTNRFTWHQSGNDAGKRKGWNDTNILEKMRLIGLGDWYDSLYRVACRSVHISSGSQSLYLTTTGSEHQVIWGPQGPKADLALVILPYACFSLLLHLDALNHTFTLSFRPTIDNLRTEVDTILMDM